MFTALIDVFRRFAKNITPARSFPLLFWPSVISKILSSPCMLFIIAFPIGEDVPDAIGLFVTGIFSLTLLNISLTTLLSNKLMLVELSTNILSE